MLVEVPVSEQEYQQLKDLSFDLCLSVRDTLKHCLKDGLQENTEGASGKIMQVLEDLHDLYYRNFLDGIDSYHKQIHAAIENGEEISSYDEAYFTATTWNDKALVLAEAIGKIRDVIGGKDGK